MTGYNPNRTPAGSPDGGKFASGDSKRDDPGQVGGAFGTFYDRREVLTKLADGVQPEQVFGPDRPLAARQLHGIVAGIEPSVDDVASAALTDDRQAQRKVAAYRNGRAFMADAYYEYGDLQLPPPPSLDGRRAVVDDDVSTIHEWQPGGDYATFAETVGTGSLVEIHMERRGKARTIRGITTYDPKAASTLTVLDRQGYEMGLDQWGAPNSTITALRVSKQES